MKLNLYEVELSFVRKVICNGRDMYGMSASWIGEKEENKKYNIAANASDYAVNYARRMIQRNYGDVLSIEVIKFSKIDEIFIDEMEDCGT